MKKIIILMALFCGIAYAQQIPQEVFLDMTNGDLVINNTTTLQINAVDSLYMAENNLDKAIINSKDNIYVYQRTNGTIITQYSMSAQCEEYLQARFNPQTEEVE